MQITFIDHSSFLIELENTILLFDWYKGEIPPLNESKQIYVFSSHKHHDHFNIEIFEKLGNYSNVHYVLSRDIHLGVNYLERNNINPSIKEKITFVGSNKTYEFGEEEKKIEVQTLTSTDAGVAFVVACEGRTFYHAGDLNWWSWPGEEFEEENQMEQDYTREIDKLKGLHIDIAFVALDPRQEERYWWGFDYFMRVVDADKVFPMHCWGNYSIITMLKKESCAIGYGDRIVTIERENQIFNI